MHALWKRFVELLSTPVDGASLAMFRIFLGLEVVLTAVSLLNPAAGSDFDYNVTAASHFSSPPAHWYFPYQGFDWLQPWPEPGMTLHCLLLAIVGVGVLLGCYYRLSVGAAFALRTYIFLLDEAIYNNHYYLECLLLFLLICMPADRAFSVDQWRRVKRASSRLRPTSAVPFWTIFLLRAQLIIVYFYGGVTKLQPQYLLDGEPMKTLLRDPLIWAPYEPYLPSGVMSVLYHLASLPATAYVLGYSGLIFDLTIGALLIARRTRALGVVLTLIFHGMNHFLFFDDIGWFPMLGATSVTIFLEPDWPRRFWRAIAARRIPRPNWPWLIGGAVALPVAGAALGWRSEPTPRRKPRPQDRIATLTLVCVCGWVLFQSLWPLRHFAIAGDVNWTNEGERFSWRMKSNLKLSRSPVFRLEDRKILSRDASGNWRVDWQALGTRPTIYHDVAPTAVDWSTMPELFIEYSPLVGERLIYNPRHGVAPDAPTRERESSRRRLDELWRKALGRELPVGQLLETQSLSDLLVEYEQQLKTRNAPAHVLDAVAYTQLRNAELGGLAPDSPDYQSRLSDLQRALIVLLDNPELDDLLQASLKQVAPFATSGSRDDGAEALVIDDPELTSRDAHGLTILNRERIAPLGGVAQHVFAELERNMHWEWLSLPRTLVYADARGQYSLLWNQHADLLRLQDSMMQVRPYMIHQYANRIADLWEAEQGRRPAVYVTNYVQLVPRPPQLLIDPTVDLAAEPLVLFGHNGWILPLEAAR